MINYYLITKPGIIFGNLLTLVAGFWLGSHEKIDWPIFFASLLGLSLVIASACVFNNYIDIQTDQKMQRTKDRALASGKISKRTAILYAILLGLSGGLVLYFFTNFLALALALTGFIIYVCIYSLIKCNTVFATALGSIAGAIPPVVGYVAASNQLDLGAAILFAILVLWQMPHFYAIAIYHLQDYEKAKIPALPLVKGIQQTKVHMLIYVVAFILTSSLLTVFGYTGLLYLAVVSLVGIYWLKITLDGFKQNNDTKWAYQMFRFSLVVIAAISIMIPLNSV